MPSSDEPYCLSAWDQAASRVHVRLAICFALDHDQSCEKVASHIKKTLRRLSQVRPYFAGRLFLGPRPGWVYMHESDQYEIPLEVHDETKSFGMTYRQFCDEGFPAHPTVHPRFQIDGNVTESYDQDRNKGVPVIVVRAFFVDGGLLLSLFFHHAFGDGDSMGKFVADFADQSRVLTPIYLKNIKDRDLNFTGYTDKEDLVQESIEDLFTDCPEYVYENKKLGPNNSIVFPGGISPDNYEKTGRTFVFDKIKVDALRSEIRQHLRIRNDDNPGFPSAYVTLAALTWVHTAAARRQGEHDIPPPDAAVSDDRCAALLNPVNWAYRTFRESGKSYFGNSVMLARTEIPISTMAGATHDLGALGLITQRINEAISLDESFVKRRLQLVDRVDDPRNIMISFDARIREDLVFNTWRDFGADSLWDLTGSGERVIKADALRRPQPEWNLVGSLILPAKRDSMDYEILVTIPAPSMDVLLADEEYTKWCRRIIG